MKIIKQKNKKQKVGEWVVGLFFFSAYKIEIYLLRYFNYASDYNSPTEG
jgi:hypothetical protein